MVMPNPGGKNLLIPPNLYTTEAYEIYISDFCDLVEGEWVILGLIILCPQNSGSALKDLFIILHNGRGEEVHEN